jgi:hypothetical protein
MITANNAASWGGTTWMERQMVQELHVLVAMTDEPDCRFVGTWLVKAAEAQTLWSQALRDPDFKDRVSSLCAYCEPDLECAALEILGALEQRHHVLATDLYEVDTGVFSIEFAMMVQLGFFVLRERSYQMTVPETVTLEKVQQAALSVSSTEEAAEDGLEIVQPEHLLHTLTEFEAQAWRSRLIEMRRFNADAPGDRTIQ